MTPDREPSHQAPDTSDQRVDPARLAAFFEGRLPAEERAEIIRQVTSSAENFDMFAATAPTRINPFRPTSAISPGMFTGRQAEVNRLARALAHTRSGKPMNFMVTGERGLGKSSLLFYLRAIAEGRLFGGFNFLVVDTDIDPGTTQTSLLSKITLGLEKSLAGSEKTRAFIHELWGFARRVEAAGVSIRDSTEPLADVAIETFSYSLAKTVEAITGTERGIFRAQHDGVLLIIDEVDNASPALQLGSFLKLLLERLDRRACTRFMVGVAGLPQMLQVFRDGHASAPRLFEVVHLQRLKSLEAAVAIEKGLEAGNEVNGRKTTVTPAALARLVEMADGIPHLLQQFAHSAFEVDEDWCIDEKDVMEGTFGEQGALATLGVRYGWMESYCAREKDLRWALLEALASSRAEWVPIHALRNDAGASVDVADEAIRHLEREKLIVRDDSSDGRVRLASSSLNSLILLQAAATVG
jgi:hypothetical protein